MSRWTVHDRYGNAIYMTQERWDYILRYHDELDGLLDELLDTLRKSRLIPTSTSTIDAVMHYRRNTTPSS